MCTLTLNIVYYIFSKVSQWPRDQDWKMLKQVKYVSLFNEEKEKDVALSRILKKIIFYKHGISDHFQE